MPKNIIFTLLCSLKIILNKLKKEFIFLFSPLNSGTTVMSQYIESLVKDSYLPPFGNNEGQNAPKLKKYFPRNRWYDKNHRDNWNYVKEVWTELLEESNKSIFIEASPPNILQIDEIIECFKPKHYLFSISSPYSHIGSCLYNYQRARSNTTKKRVQNLLNKWINYAQIIIKNTEKYGYSKEITTYESFCENPDSLVDVIFRNKEEKTIYLNEDSEKKIKGKGNSNFPKIVDMKPKHLAFLGIKNIDYISTLLSPHQEILDVFNYKILDIKDINNIIQNNLIISYDGLERRIPIDKILNESKLKKKEKRKKI